MGAVNPPSPLLFGANNIANNLENAILNADGSYTRDNGPLNLIANATFENGLSTPWALGTTGTLTNGLPTGVPTFGSGTTSLTLATTTSSPLYGTTSLVLTASAATTAGNMFSSGALAVPIGLQGKVISWSFGYEATANASNGNFSGTSSNSFGVAIYDVTNSAWLGTAGQFNLVQSSGVGNCTGTAQLPINTTSIQFCVYCVSATAGAITMAFDQFYLGPQTSANAPAMSDWVAYTPTITGFGTPANVSFRSRRVGDSLEVLGFFQSGTATAVTSAITIGYNGANANVSIDNTKLPADPINSEALVGGASVNSSSTTLFNWTVLAPTTSSGTTVNLGLQSSTVSGSAASNGSVIVSGTQSVELFFTVPIVGWSSNTVSSADTDTRVIAAYGVQQTPTGTVSSSFSVAKFGTVTKDVTGGYSAASGLYTTSVSGWYQCNSSIEIQGTANLLDNNARIAIFQNGAQVVVSGQTEDAASGTVNLVPSISQAVYCNAGDTLGFYTSSTLTSPVYGSAVTAGCFSIFRLSGPAVVQATESVNASYNISGSQSIPNSTVTALTILTTKNFDSHNVFNTATGIYTIPVSGKYRVSFQLPTNATVAAIVGNNMQILVAHAGSNTTNLQGITVASTTTALLYIPSVTGTLSCQAGDTLTFQCQMFLTGSAVSVGSGAGVAGIMSIERVGN